jgi:DNA-binding helix-hairpin-helix protein with protein kinase domain
LGGLQSSLVACAVAPGHFHAASAVPCPWCEIEDESGAQLFVALVRPVAGVPIDLASVWARIEQIEDSGDPEPLPEDDDWVQPTGLVPQRWITQRRVAKAIVGVGFAGALVFNQPFAALCVLLMGIIAAGIMASRPKKVTPEQTQAWDVYRRALLSWQLLVNDWTATTFNGDFTTLKQHLKGIKEALEDLSAERQQRLAALGVLPAGAQMDQYLAGFRVEDAKLHNIGPARSAELRSWGIDTAADVDRDRILQIPGFGPTMVQRLVNWRRQLEKRFRYKPAQNTNRRDVQRIDRDLARRRTQLMTDLRAGIGPLEDMSKTIRDARARLRPQIEAAFEARMMAKVKLDAARQT